MQVESSESEAGDEAAAAAPFVKWAGGKRSTIHELGRRLPAEFGQYYEPFAGGAALFFHLRKRLATARLSDTNLELVLAYNAVKKNPHELIDLLEQHAREHSSTHYYAMRALHGMDDAVERAARFLYLNKTCYNGLYRVNLRGEFNVPLGKYLNPNIVARDNILASSSALQVAEIKLLDFRQVAPSPGDFVYFDPPYHPADQSSFTKYTKLNFTEKDQVELCELALRLHRQGVQVMLSNSDTEFIRHLYRGRAFRIATVEAPRFVNCKPDGRSAVRELLITNY